MKTIQIIFIVIILLLIAGLSYFSVKHMYSENFNVKSRCKPGHELYWNTENKKMECKECDAGMYSCNGFKCKPCSYNQWSEKGANKCNHKSVCNNNLKVTNPTFEKIEISDIPEELLDSLYSKVKKQHFPSQTKSTEFKNNVKSLIKNKIKYNISTESDKGNDRECVKLNKCDLMHYSPNYDTSYIKDDTGNAKTDKDTKIFMEDLKCKKLYECNDNNKEYWYNYEPLDSGIDSMKNQQDNIGVFTTDRQCRNLTNCEPGKYHNRLRKFSDFYIEDRNCQDCEGNIANNPNYTDKPNQTRCIPQEKCRPGEYVNKNDISPFGGSLVVDKQIDCEPCNNFFYTDKANFDVKCKEQNKCPAGKYDEKYPLKNRQRPINECKDCECDTYTDGSSHVTKCAIQPKIGTLGIGSVGYIGEAEYDLNPDVKCTTDKRMITEVCDGDENYQDEIGHRNPCKDHITCGQGELISPINAVKSRTCNKISTKPYLENCSGESGECLYMPHITHRFQKGLSQPKCDDENKLLYLNNPSKFTKEKVECKSMREAISEIENTDINLII